MIDWIAILYYILLMIPLLPLHELSHYYVLKDNGLDGKFGVKFNKRNPLLFALYVQYNIQSNIDSIPIITRVASLGWGLPTLYIYLLILLLDFPLDIGLIIIIVFLIYSNWETIATVDDFIETLKEEKKKEDKE